MQQVDSFIDKVQALTNSPFIVNNFLDYNDYGQGSLAKPDEIVQIETHLVIDADNSFIIPPSPNMDDLVALLADRRVQIVSTTFGLLKDEDVATHKQAGIKLMTTVNAFAKIDLAIKTQDSDILIFQNAQVIGNKGGFSDDDHGDVSDFFPVMQNHPDRFFVLVGGIVTRHDIERALKIGFAGVQIGIGFLATEQSLASMAYKQSITNVVEQDNTVLTTTLQGNRQGD